MSNPNKWHTLGVVVLHDPMLGAIETARLSLHVRFPGARLRTVGRATKIDGATIWVTYVTATMRNPDYQTSEQRRLARIQRDTL